MLPAERVAGSRCLRTCLPKQEEAIEGAVNAMRKKPGRLRVVDLVDEVSARCRLCACPALLAQPSIDA